MESVHPNQKSNYCNYKSCKLKLSESNDIEAHYVNAHEKKTKDKEIEKVVYKCNICEKTCQSTEIAISHYQTWHESKKSKNRGFKCRICEKFYRTIEDRKLHHITEHAGEKLSVVQN